MVQPIIEVREMRLESISLKDIAIGGGMLIMEVCINRGCLNYYHGGDYWSIECDNPIKEIHPHELTKLKANTKNGGCFQGEIYLHDFDSHRLIGRGALIIAEHTKK